MLKGITLHGIEKNDHENRPWKMRTSVFCEAENQSKNEHEQSRNEFSKMLLNIFCETVNQ